MSQSNPTLRVSMRKLNPFHRRSADLTSFQFTPKTCKLCILQTFAFNQLFISEKH
jgi:hypothetical protein